MLNTYITACILESITGIAVADCDLKSLGDTMGISLLSKDVSFLKTLTDADFKTNWENYVSEGKIVPLKQVFDFTQNTGENEVATSSLGIKTKIREAKADFTFRYDRSHCFDNQLSKLMNKEWDIVLHMSKGLLMTTDEVGTVLKGFDVSYSDKSTFKLQQGTDPQSSSVMIQFSPMGTEEFNYRKVVIDTVALGFNPFNLNGLVQLDLSFDIAPIVGAEQLTIKVLNACSGNPVTGIANAGYWGLISSEANTITGTPTDEGGGIYTIDLTTPLVLNETVRAYLTDGTYNSITTPLGVKYTGSTPTVKTV